MSAKIAKIVLMIFVYLNTGIANKALFIYFVILRNFNMIKIKKLTPQMIKLWWIDLRL